MNYSFKRQINDPKQKEAVRFCAKYEMDQGFEIIDVSENPDWYDRGVDLIVKYPNFDMWIDVKCDERIAETGNIAFELIEIASYEGYLKRGYAYSKVHYIYYFDWHNKKFYKFRTSNLLKIAFSKSRKSFATYHPEERYFTLGILIPLQELCQN